MTNLHIFNPEHDLALAAGIGNVTPPAPAVRLARGLAYIPAFWADEGDVVLVDDKKRVAEDAQLFKPWMADVEWVDFGELKSWVKNQGGHPFTVVPWGWDAAVCSRMRKAGVRSDALLSDDGLETVRRLSGRATSVELLRAMKADMPWVEGESVVVHSMDEITQRLMEWGRVVLKSPWSCSGRGVKFISDAADSATRSFAHTPLAAWAQHILDAQGYLTVEHFLDMVHDFGMEFYAHENGEVEYGGLSVFSAEHGAYSGNIIGSEKQKTELLSCWIPNGTLDTIREWLCIHLQSLLQGMYTGPLGMDMMVVRTPHGYAVNPCVEINLRRTMGHLSLALYQRGVSSGRFTIQNYQLHIYS